MTAVPSEQSAQRILELTRPQVRYQRHRSQHLQVRFLYQLDDTHPIMWLRTGGLLIAHPCYRRLPRRRKSPPCDNETFQGECDHAVCRNTRRNRGYDPRYRRCAPGPRYTPIFGACIGEIIWRSRRRHAACAGSFRVSTFARAKSKRGSLWPLLSGWELKRLLISVDSRWPPRGRGFEPCCSRHKIKHLSRPLCCNSTRFRCLAGAH